jgi:hypothetical protein
MLICGRNAYTALPIAIIAIKIEKTDAKISSRMANILSWIAAALLGAASAVVLALLVWNGFLYPEYLRQPPLARPFSHGSFAPVGDDDDWTFKPQFAENAAVSFGSSGASATRYGPHRRCPHSPDCCSGMRRRRPAPHHVFGDCRLGDLKAKHRRGKCLPMRPFHLDRSDREERRAREIAFGPNAGLGDRLFGHHC